MAGNSSLAIQLYFYKSVITKIRHGFWNLITISNLIMKNPVYMSQDFYQWSKRVYSLARSIRDAISRSLLGDRHVLLPSTACNKSLSYSHIFVHYNLHSQRNKSRINSLILQLLAWIQNRMSNKVLIWMLELFLAFICFIAYLELHVESLFHFTIKLLCVWSVGHPNTSIFFCWAHWSTTLRIH